VKNLNFYFLSAREHRVAFCHFRSLSVCYWLMWVEIAAWCSVVFEGFYKFFKFIFKRIFYLFLLFLIFSVFKKIFWVLNF
jgi:hypothetical protein